MVNPELPTQERLFILPVQMERLAELSNDHNFIAMLINDVLTRMASQDITMEYLTNFSDEAANGTQGPEHNPNLYANAFFDGITFGIGAAELFNTEIDPSRLQQQIVSFSDKMCRKIGGVDDGESPRSVRRSEYISEFSLKWLERYEGFVPIARSVVQKMAVEPEANTEDIFIAGAGFGLGLAHLAVAHEADAAGKQAFFRDLRVI